MVETTLLADWLSNPTAIVQLVAGVVLLLFGRRLFWLLVAALGFFLGVGLADTYFSAESEMLRWGVGLLAGLLAGMAMVFVQKFAVRAAGLLVAGYSTWWYLSLTWAPLEPWSWGLVAVAAVVGVLVAGAVFDFGLIFVSALAGATLLLDGFGPEAATSRWMFLVLVLIGVAVQASSRSDKGEKD